MAAPNPSARPSPSADDAPDAAVGMAHPTVVPVNFDADDQTDRDD
ncbi:hypothetical protein [Haloterrigena alkaliphila]|nr:hypothetical protein [Haloterrigena alkaliphila]